jgi:hypothetical protein
VFQNALVCVPSNLRGKTAIIRRFCEPKPQPFGKFARCASRMQLLACIERLGELFGTDCPELDKGKLISSRNLSHTEKGRSSTNPKSRSESIRIVRGGLDLNQRPSGYETLGQKNTPRLVAVASEGTPTAFVLLPVPNSVPKAKGPDSLLDPGLLTIPWAGRWGSTVRMFDPRGGGRFSLSRSSV